MKNKILYFSLFILLLIFGYIELIHPYHFLRNDNLFQFFPVINHAFQTLFSGQIPLLNQHQSFGVPLFEMGYYPILYPLLMLSYLVSKMFDNTYLLFEIFTFLHLLISFTLTFFFLEKNIKNDLLSSAGAFSFIFCGYIMIKLHDWFFLAPTLILLPLIFLFHKQIESKKNSKKLYIWLGVLRGIFFYSGNIQFLVYSFFFELIYVILKFNSKKYDFKKIINYKLSLVLSLLIGLPNLILVFLMSINSSRQPSIAGYFFSDYSNPIHFLIGNLIPSSLLNSKNFGFYFVNSILFIGFSLYLIKKLKKDKFRMFGKNPYLTLALFAIVLSFGLFGGLYILFTIIPIWNNFIHPQKLLVFANFFIILIGVKYFSKIKNKKLHFGILILTLILILVQIPNYSKTNSFYQETVPFKELDFDNNGRVLTLLKKSNSYDTFNLGQNYATFYKLYHVTGYDHLMPKINRYISPINLHVQFLYKDQDIDKDTLSEYSVRYIISDYKITNFDLIKSEKNYFIYENTNFKPFLFEAESYEKFDFIRNQNGIEFESNFNKETYIIFTNLFHEAYNLYIDNEKFEIRQDNYGRINFIVPKGKHTVELKYERPTFFNSLVISLVLIIILLLFWNNINLILSNVFKFLLPFIKNIFNLSFKYWLIPLIILGLIYSGFFIMTFNNQGFIDPILTCEKNNYVNCIITKVNDYKTKQICQFYQKNNIGYNLFGKINNFCS